ncbi:MAG: formyltetrahydrofolate deformylase [Planctomycetes bacterium]|nr:formyltetrahydrofolate deformylase [Planctomycetota bacterium]
MAVETARLLISCPDARGIIAAVAGFVAEYDGNILEADQHSDPQHQEFFMRVEVELESFRLNRATFAQAWGSVADKYKMRWRVYWGNEVKRMAILVSKETHCLSDLLWRWKTGELNVEIPFVAGNHAELKDEVEPYGISFHHLPITSKTRSEQESVLSVLLNEASVDFIVLARYMQILSPKFVAGYAERIINIHHSFLPAFAGPRPYHQAYDRGVKIIGATSHYVTDVLDEGPIIAQSTLPVDHRDTVDDLSRKGRDLERVVLATAVRQHVEDKILVNQNKTVVFD